MTATLLSAAVTCVAALFLGQAALRLAGAREWNWLAPQVGVSVAMLVAFPAIYVPGRSVTGAVVLACTLLVALVWCARAKAHRPPISGVIAGAPVGFLVLLPFLAVGHAGILGVSVNNDMAAHMWLVEGYLSKSVGAVVLPQLPDYPLGPHAVAAMIAKALGPRSDQALVGVSIALPLLNAWTAQALAPRANLLTRAMVATVVGMPFLVAAYYGEGAFKEVMQAGLVLAVALMLAGYGPALKRGRWVPLALLLAGIVSVYSVTGLPWPLMFIGIALALVGVRHAKQGSMRTALDELRVEMPAIGIAAAVFCIALLPQVPRIARFLSRGGTGIPDDALGNLVGPLPGWEVFGVWNNPDFRLPPSPAFTGGMWTAFVLALVLVGLVWSIRRGRWLIPLAAGGSMLIWEFTTLTQSPYVAAKALVLASPLVLALAACALVEGQGGRSGWSASLLFARGPQQPLALGLAILLGLLLVYRVGISDFRALRASAVGPTDRLEELRSFRPLLNGQPTMFLGNDDFVYWELAGVPLAAPVFGNAAQAALRPQKQWSIGDAVDLDLIDADTLNSYRWVITSRDAGGSESPSQLRIVRSTQNYTLWQRMERVRERSILNEGEMPGAILDCGTPFGRAVLRRGGFAKIRAKPVVVQGPAVAADDTASASLSLSSGSWDLTADYTSPLPVDIMAPGLHARLPANLSRPGPRWPIGRLAVTDGRPATFAFSVDAPFLAPSSAAADFRSVVATRSGARRVVPIRRACGRYVDWYRPERR